MQYQVFPVILVHVKYYYWNTYIFIKFLYVSILLSVNGKADGKFVYRGCSTDIDKFDTKINKSINQSIKNQKNHFNTEK